MSHNLINFIDGVPVKISEKYKPPPKITLPQVIIQRLSNKNLQNSNYNYDFMLENNVLSKINEWKEVRQRENLIKTERCRLREEKKLKLLEETQKKLLTEVSYPSAEDFQTDDDEAKCMENNRESEKSNISVTQFSPPTDYDKILMPTIVPGLNLNEDTSSNSIKYNANNNFTTKYNTKINYSDFENDTSSPFDNMELKTMNDLDILAQVLKFSTKLNKSENEEFHTIDADNNSGCTINPTDQKNMNRETFTQHQNYENSIDQYCNTMDNIYIYQQRSTFNPQETDIKTGNHLNYLNNVNYPISSSNEESKPNFNMLMFPHLCYQNSKSKSVPDIVKELNADIKDSETKRIRNNSQSIENSTRDILYNKKDNEINSVNKETTISDENFNSLSYNLKQLATNISSMGFPLPRVSKIVKIFGNDDKKVIEHLIPLSELLDLGFEETKISEALVKFNNNKEKALDFLIS